MSGSGWVGVGLGGRQSCNAWVLLVSGQVGHWLLGEVG